MKLPFILLAMLPLCASAKPLSQQLNIEVTSSKNSTAMVYGTPMYVKTFGLSVTSSAVEPVELTKKNGCFIPKTDKGQTYQLERISLSLIGTLKRDESKEGTITFISSNKGIYDAEFVMWKDQCGLQ